MDSDRTVEIMKILFSPQINQAVKLNYKFSGEVVTVTYGSMIDSFDFSDMPIGILDSVETTLPVNPIIQAERKDDGLYVTLLNYIDDDATQEEKFPSWVEV
jgi:hypothetical protein